MLRLLGNVRYQIALILLLAVVPLALLSLYLAVDDGRKDSARAQADSREAVRLVALDVNRVIQSSRDLVRGLSEYSEIRNHPDSCHAQLASLKPALPQFANMVLVDGDSTVLCAASDPKNIFAIPKSPENLALMDRVRRSRQVEVGSFVLMAAPGRRVLPVMGPVIDGDDRIRSFFRVTVDLDWLAEQIDNVAIPPEAVLLVMDDRGTEIARNPRSPDWPPGTPAPPFERTLVGKGDFDGEVTGADGIDRFYSVENVRAGKGLLVVMKTRSSEIYRPARRRLMFHLSGLLIVGLLVLGLTWLGSDRYFRHPLSRLMETANQLASGRLDARSRLKYGGEIGVLAQSFDQMADTLERNRSGEKQAAAREAGRLRRLKQLSELSMMLAGDPATVFERIVRLIGELFEVRGVCLSEITGPDLAFRAVYVKGKVISNAGGCPIEITPCATVQAARDIRIYDRVQELFPRAAFLRDHDAFVWCGFPSVDNQGNVIAVTCLVDDKPREFTEEDQQILWVVGQRIAAEFDRARSMAEHARMEEALRENERRLEEAQQMAHLGNYTGDPATGRMEWSEELYRIYEIDPAGGNPSVDLVMARAHPDDRALILKTREDSRRGDGRFNFEHRLLMPDGRIKDVLVQGTLSSGADGRPRLGGTVQDITALKRAEEEKAKLQAQLNQAQKMESIGRLAGGVAHDFNNLLTVINGYSDVLMHQLAGPVRKYAEQINKAGESAASLTRQLLAFSRMEMTDPQPVLLNDIVTESRDMLERLVGVDIEMKTSLQASPDEVLADPNQIHQCLMNLVVNARDAMPAGGQLTIETGNVNVDARDLPPGGNGAPGPHVRLTVRDTGTGMDEETGQRIFEPFFTTKEKGRGTGLGLSTVYGIVSQWQGFLKVASEPGKGSEFSIYLALSSTLKPPQTDPAAKTGASPAASGTVLVVEDQDIVREFVVESLRMYGYTVLEARNGVEALQVIERNGAGIHLMMTDVMMPGMRGQELAARAHAVCPSMKILFMTGYSDNEGPDGDAEVIMKPFAPEALEARVRNLLQLH
jgi:signal transduction histidine kinase/CheY-like chemotaxis protein/HAMP domain-containing protein